MRLTNLGHSAFIVEEEGFKAIIDPFISGNSLSKVKVEDINGLTHIFITHGHGDHIGDGIELAKTNDALVIANAEISGFLSSKGVKTHAMHIGGRYKFDFGIVKLTPALHGSGIPTEEGMIYGGNPCGFVIEVNNKKIYHAGDTALFSDMKLIGERHPIDLAFLPIGDNFTMGPEDAATAVEFLKPKTVVPIHYNTFPYIKQDPQQFVELVHSSEVKVLSAGDEVEL